MPPNINICNFILCIQLPSQPLLYKCHCYVTSYCSLAKLKWRATQTNDVTPSFLVSQVTNSCWSKRSLINSAWHSSLIHIYCRCKNCSHVVLRCSSDVLKSCSQGIALTSRNTFRQLRTISPWDKPTINTTGETVKTRKREESAAKI